MPEAEAAVFEDTEGWACADIEDNEQNYLRYEESLDKGSIISKVIAITIILEMIISACLSFITVTVSACNDQNTEVGNDEAAMSVVAD